MASAASEEADRWLIAAKQALVSGTLASVFSTGVLAWLGQRHLGRPFAPTNATSHWLWGDLESTCDGGFSESPSPQACRAQVEHAGSQSTVWKIAISLNPAGAVRSPSMEFGVSSEAAYCRHCGTYSNRAPKSRSVHEDCATHSGPYNATSVVPRA
jgi:hypothetical protein